ADAGDAAAAVAAALFDYLRVRLGTAGTPGIDLLAQALEGRGVGSEQVDELREMLERIDSVRYGATADSADALGSRVVRWAESVDPILAREGGS
ncbi:MAG: hypothetical protein OXC31_08405, partial [Spirochaetaceae bacterium]|nr:hypothetical protein [Spirochaetaceae bacterium]